MTRIFVIMLTFLLFFSCANRNYKETHDKELAANILADTLLPKVKNMALNVVKGGFSAGDGYGEVWIRDFNTFIELAMDVMPDEKIRENLITFFKFQGPEGDIVDGFIPVDQTTRGYKYRYSKLEPRYAAHKNTVETDQEASLIQAVGRYVRKSGNKNFLYEVVDGKTVLERLEFALNWLMKERYDKTYGLIWGATTSDWGDVQPEHQWGVELDDSSHLAIDIYDNAFFIIAIQTYLSFQPENAKRGDWQKIRDSVFANVRKHLWDDKKQKFIPHIYLNGSPFPADFDENAIYYHGGTAMAIEAGILTKDEIQASYTAMVNNVKLAGAQTIGLTVYPAYPKGFFKNDLMAPYSYQNGGDWTWFGGRMISQLIRNGFVREAYEQVQPMLARVVKNNGFYEWYALDGTPSGSGAFRGEAGVLASAIQEFEEWAKNNSASE